MKKKFTIIILALLLMGWNKTTRAQSGLSCDSARTFIYDPDITPEESFLSGKVWYKFTALSDSIDATFTEWALDTTNMFSKITLWSGTCSGLSLVTSDTISGWTDSVLVLSTTSLTMGNTYYVLFEKTDTTSTAELKFHTFIDMHAPLICPGEPAICPEMVRNGDFEQFVDIPTQQNVIQDCGWEEGWVYPASATIVSNNPYDNVGFGYYPVVGTYPTTLYTHPYYCSPDAFNAGSALATAGVPANSQGNQNSTDPLGNTDGQGYAGFYSYQAWVDNTSTHAISANPEYKEYIYQEITCNLLEGVTYDASFMVSLADNSVYASNHIGMYFYRQTADWPLPYMADPYTLTSTPGAPVYADMVSTRNYLLYNPGASTVAGYNPNTMALTSVIPQIQQPSYGAAWATSSVHTINGVTGPNNFHLNGGYMTDKTKWMQVSGTFTPANSGTYVIIIGNFQNDDYVPLNPALDPSFPDANHPGHLDVGAHAYYYIDQVSLHVDEAAIAPTLATEVIPCSIKEGGQSVSYTITPHLTIAGATYTATSSSPFISSISAIAADGSFTINWLTKPTCDVTIDITISMCECDHVFPLVIFGCCETKDLVTGKIGPVLGDLGYTVDGFPAVHPPLDHASQFMSGMSVNPSLSVFDIYWASPGMIVFEKAFSINGNFYVDHDLTLEGCEVFLGHEAKIIVSPGIKFELEDCHLLSCCDDMWNGIEVPGGDTPGKITVDNSLLEDADSAITSLNGGLYSISETVFNKNYKGLVVRDFKGTWSGDHQIDHSIFTCRDLTTLGLYAGNIYTPLQDFIWGVYNQSVYPTYTYDPMGISATGLYWDYNMNSYVVPNTAGDYKFSFLKWPRSKERSHVGVDVEYVSNSIPLEIGDQTYLTGNANETNDGMNTFDFLDYGIRSIYSNTSVYNNLFFNIYNIKAGTLSGQGGDPLFLNTAAVYAYVKYAGGLSPGVPRYLIVGGDNTVLPSQTNWITNCDNGVFSYNNNTQVINNQIWDGMTYGVLLDGGQGRTNDVLINTIGNVHYGISAVNLLADVATTIRGNHISMSSFPYLSTVKNSFGIGIFTTIAANPSPVLIDDNHFGMYTFDNSHTCDGIRMQGNTDNTAEILNSHIDIYADPGTLNNAGNPAHGIWTEDVDKANIHDNFMENKGASVGGSPWTPTASYKELLGILNDVTTNTKVWYNHTGYMSTGIGLNDNCVGSLYGCNKLDKCYDGFYFNFGTAPSISNQLTTSSTDVTGNIWNNPNAPFYAAPNYDLAGNTTSTLRNWYYNNTVYTPFSIVNPAEILTVNTSNSDQCTHTPPTSMPVLSGNVLRTVTVSDREEMLGSIIRGEAQYDTLAAERLLNDTIYAYRIISRDASMINIGAQDDNLYQAFYAIASTKNVGKFEQVTQYILSGDIASAIFANNAIIPNNNIETNERAVNDILLAQLNYLMDTTKGDIYVLDQEQRATLHAIAVQSPTYGGEAVYRARTMLWIDVPNETPVNPNQPQQFRNRVESKTSNYKLYPNPNSGNMVLEYKLEGTESAEFRIYDIAGRLVKQLTLDAGNKTVLIDGTELNAGIYYYDVKDGENNRKSEKLIIIK